MIHTSLKGDPTLTPTDRSNHGGALLNRALGHVAGIITKECVRVAEHRAEVHKHPRRAINCGIVGIGVAGQRILSLRVVRLLRGHSPIYSGVVFIAD